MCLEVESGCLSVFRCVCVLSMLFMLFFQVSVTIVDFLFCPKFFRVNLVECVFSILLGKYLSYSDNV